MHDCYRVYKMYTTAAHAGGTGASVPVTIKLDGELIHNVTDYFGYSSDSASAIGYLRSRLHDKDWKGGRVLVGTTGDNTLILAYPSTVGAAVVGLEFKVNNTLYVPTTMGLVGTMLPPVVGAAKSLAVTLRQALINRA